VLQSAFKNVINLPRGRHLLHCDTTTAINNTPETVVPRSSKASVPVLGVADKIGEGDTYLVENVLPPELAEVVFEKLMKEVVWNVMHHRGSLALLTIPIAREDTTSPIGGEVPRLVS
jgi:hypothetical protein